uniref:Uncharacterized protein n=1 Tax=Guillardia theta TaxID=55529 RepID=A0A6U5ZSI8_GUITH
MSEETFVTPLKAASTAKDAETAANVEISSSLCLDTDLCFIGCASFFARVSPSRLLLDPRSLLATLGLAAMVLFAHDDAWRAPFKPRLALFDAKIAEDMMMGRQERFWFELE